MEDKCLPRWWWLLVLFWLLMTHLDVLICKHNTGAEFLNFQIPTRPLCYLQQAREMTFYGQIGAYVPSSSVWFQ